MSSFEVKQEKLKRAVIAYLKTCPGRKCFRHDIWNNVSSFMQEPLNRKNYGVSKMHAFLDKFNDVLKSEGEYVVLRQQINEDHDDSVVLVSSDDSENESSFSATSSLTFTSKGAKSEPGSKKKKFPTECRTPGMDFQERVISILLAEYGKMSIFKFEDVYQSKYGPITDFERRLLSNSNFVACYNDNLFLQPQAYAMKNIEMRGNKQKDVLDLEDIDSDEGTTSAASPVWGSGIAATKGAHTSSLPATRRVDRTSSQLSGSNDFISFSDDFPGPPSRGVPQGSQQRYGLNTPTKQTAVSVVRPFSQTPESTNQVNSGVFPSLIESFFQNFKGNLQQQPQMSAFASPALLNPQMAASSSAIIPGVGAPQIPNPAPQFPTPAPLLSEWPILTPRTGPPPGTKITDDVKEISVKRVSLPSGSRLTSDHVNFQIQECIDMLSEANEHVSMERLESMLLQKYQVRHFRALNLREIRIDMMPAAKDHDMKIGKVNAYIHNFIWSRSSCTLYELKECCREFHTEKKDFEHLKLGPLQKMPLIYDLFKFPMDEYIPEITSVDLIECLHRYIDKNQKWTQKVSMEDFMKYLMEVYHVSNGLSLGIRIRSMPLAIQMLKKSKRDAAASRKSCAEELKQALNKDIVEAFVKFRASILQTSQDGSLELRRHYMNLSPEDVVKDIINKFELLTHILASDTPFYRKVDKMLKYFDHFVKNVLDVPIPRMLYHLSVCMSNLQVQESAQEYLQQEAKRQEQQAATKIENASPQQKMAPTKVMLSEKIISYLNRCLEHGSLQLAHLSKIESKVVEDYGFSSFVEMNGGRFLEFVLSEPKIKAIMDESGGTVLGSSSGSHETESMYRPSQLELLQFIDQSKHAGTVQNNQVENAVCEQFRVTDLRHLGHGNITRLCGAADKPGKHVSKEYNVNFEAAICGKLCPTPRSTGKVGILGSQSKEMAMACLTNCPLLEDMMEWSHWSLVFQPQYGSLRSFIEKHGGLQEIPLEGGRKTATSDFMALEVEPGLLLKINSQTTQEQFCAVLASEDPITSAGYLVSLIVANKGLESTPMALLTNHVKTHLIALHARSSGVSVPRVPSTFDNYHTVDLAVQFVTEMLLRLPVRICVAIANQILLEPLSSVVGSAKSKKEILQACRLPTQMHRLELLGCLLGLPEWTSSLQQKFQFEASHLTDVIEDEMMGAEDTDMLQGEENETKEESDYEEDSDIDSILSDEENPQQLPDGENNMEEQEGSSEASGKDDDDEEGEESTENSEVGDDDDEVEEEEKQEEIGDSQAELAEPTELPDKDSIVSESLGEDLKITDEVVVEQEEELTREQICQRVVELIQREEFGLGIQLDETGEKLMRKQQERQGRSLQRLSKDLYSKETHFVLELIQNADDNSYDDDIVPAVKFVIDFSGVTVLNNEMGFEEKNIRALCDVGKSTKEKHKFGYIGQKGIGFKSVFRVTGRPEVHSNGFHICFDVDSGPMGYILPHWISEIEEDGSWQTRIALPWTEEIKQQIRSHASRFNDIQPSLLLFLHRLKEITIENKVENCVVTMQRKDLPDREVQISHGSGTDRWLVLRKILDASSVSLQTKSGVEVESTEIALAFPLHDKAATVHSQTKPGKLPVFAFLPLRSYGFRFIIQGDFDVPSSREDVDRDSSWNQWLRNEIHVLFVEALDAFKTRPDLSPIKALMLYLQFIPLEGEVMDFFKPVSTKILAQLRAKECMPVLTANKKNIQWKMPSKTVITKDSLVLEIISPEFLQAHLGLYYLHPDVAAVLDEALIHALGVESVTTEHLLHIGQSISLNWNDSDSAEQVTELAKWLACVYRSLDDFQDNSQIIDKLCSFRIIPLSDGSLVSLSDVTVFLLSDGRQEVDTKAANKRGNTRDPLFELKKDLKIVHSDLTHTSDNEVNSQVVKILLKMGLKQMAAHDLIHSHILPTLKSEAWREKTRDVLISYLVYIKTEMDRNPSVVEWAELRPVARLATNHGIKSPETDDVHFSSAFGNKIDLRAVFPGIEWTLVDSAYLPRSPTQLDLQTWHNFLSELGVVNFLRVRKTEICFDKSNIHETAWSVFKDLWPDSPDGYTVTDFQCEEFLKLVAANQNVDQHYEQMVALYEMLDMEWDGKYKRYAHTQLMSASGHELKDVIQTSFAIYLETMVWIPSVWQSVTLDDDNKTVESSIKKDLHTPAELYIQDNNIKNLLAHTVKYLKVIPQKKSSFTQHLKIKSSVGEKTVKEALISWGSRTEGSLDTPKIFCTSMKHVLELYTYLGENLSRKDAQDLFHSHPTIFVPVFNCSQIREDQILIGKMLKREEVWWSDPTDLFTKYRDSLELYMSPLAKRKFLQCWYNPMEEMFKMAVRVETEPGTYDLAQLLKHIATVHSLCDTDVLRDSLFLFSKIGTDLMKITSTVGGVKSTEAQIAEANLPKVINLLTNAAVFPTKKDQWVSLTDHPMVSDSQELEEMFNTKPGVHLLRLEVMESGNLRNRGHKNMIDQDALKYCISLFDAIKPLSHCIKTEEITSHFKQCIKGQKFMHEVVGLVQRFLFFIFPDVHEKIKEKKAGSLKELVFSQVKQLEVRYELIDRPEVYEIRQEKCVVRDKHFFFHEQYIGIQSHINREVAKYFSEDNEDCVRELRSFLSEVAHILDGSSDETIEGFLARQRRPIGSLPASEEVWEIPPPVIKVEPKPVVVADQGQTMVYGRALSQPDVEKQTTGDADEENAGIKSWPPKSSLHREHTEQSRKQDGTQPGIWPPPSQGPNYARTSKLLPSNIKFEKADQENAEEGAGPESERKPSQSGTSYGASGNFDDGKVSRTGGLDTEGNSQGNQGYQSYGRSTSRQTSDGDGHARPASDGDRKGAHRQVSDGEFKHGERRGSTDGTTRAENDDVGTGEKNKSTEYASTGKRKLTESSTEDETVGVKRLNSQENEQDLEKQPLGEGEAERQAQSGKQLTGDGMRQENMEEDMDVTRYGHDGSSSRDVTPSSSSSNQDVRRSNKKSILQFTIPVWNENFEDKSFMELSKTHDLTIPSINLSEESPPAEIGHWGEKLVWDYLEQQRESNSRIIEVVWANENGEKGFPFDFEIVYSADDSDEKQRMYIEVKATLSWDKEHFPVSSKQIEFALQQKENYEIYRVFGAGNVNTKLVRVTNVAEKMKSHAVRLFMVL